jgi:hypothetical protein
VTASCRHDPYADPVSTVETLQDAIADKDWDLARQSFSSEIQQLNAGAISSERFYKIDYWRRTRTMQNLFVSPLILPESAEFRVADQSDNETMIAVSYPDARDKDLRLQQITLRRDPAGQWKVVEIYGQSAGVE